MDAVCPLKLQKTWLSGYCPFVWFTIASSRTCVAAGMALTLPQNAGGGAPPPPPAVLTVQVKVVAPVAPVVSLAVTVVVEVAAVVGVPVISPEELIDSPAGRPVAVKVSVWPDAESVAVICVLTAVPTTEFWVPGLVTVTMLPPGLLTTQLNEADPEAPVPSVAVTTVVEVAAVVGVPVISPEELIDSPAGRPVAVKASVWPVPESVAVICLLTAVPTVELWLPGLVTVTVLPLVPAKTWNSKSE